MFAHSQELDTLTGRQIDVLAHKLYGLSEEEIAIMEGA